MKCSAGWFLEVVSRCTNNPACDQVSDVTSGWSPYLASNKAMIGLRITEVFPGSRPSAGVASSKKYSNMDGASPIFRRSVTKQHTGEARLFANLHIAKPCHGLLRIFPKHNPLYSRRRSSHVDRDTVPIGKRNWR